MQTTWDGLPVAGDRPHGVTVVVRRPGEPAAEFLVLHRAARDDDGDWAWTSPAGARLPDEPVHQAALRELREEAGVADADVWAVDLSGDWAVFACDVPAGQPVTLVDPEHDRYAWLPAPEASRRVQPAYVGARVAQVAAIPPVRLGFRPMERTDFPLVVRWQNEPHVARWYGDEALDLDRAERHYGPALDGADPTRMWVVEADGRPLGQIQDYRIGDHPDYSLLTARPDAVGFDYLVGDPALVGRGLGTRMIWAFLRDVVRPHHPHATTFFAAPDHRNAASLRVLDKVGCVRGLWFDEPRSGGGVDTVVSCTFDVARLLGPGPGACA